MLNMQLLSLIFLAANAVRALNTSLAIVPQMAFNTWNLYGCNINSSIIESNAKAIKEEGLLDLGYRYISIDDCWQADARNSSNGNPAEDLTKFPNGMKGLVDDLHAMGFMVGIYSDAGKYTCGGKFGSLDHETIDAQWYADTGFDYLKYDNCFNEGRSGTPNISFARYETMGNALNATGRPIFYSMCSWGDDAVWNWASTIANSWRMSGDVYDNFDRYDDRCPCQDSHSPCLLAGYHCSIMNIMEKAAGLGQKARTGSWMDMDGLEVGNGEMTFDEYKVQMSIWCIAKSALLISNDITNMDAETKSIIANKHLIDVSQDPEGSAGIRMWKKNYDEGSTQLWKGNLGNSSYVMAVVNATPKNMSVEVKMSDFFIDEGKNYASNSFQLYDLWDDAKLWKTVSGSFSTDVNTHGVQVYKVMQA